MADWGEKIDGGWFLEDRHEYRDEQGNRVLSVTQIFDVLKVSDFSKVNPDDLQWKREFGNAIHRAIELLVFGRLDWDSCDEQIIPAVTGLECWLCEMQYEPLAVEEKKIIIVNGMAVGGTLDHRGSLMYGGARRPAILDVKSGSKFSVSWLWQVACYCSGAPKSPLGRYVAAAIQVGKDGVVRPFWADTIKHLRDFTTLLAAANILLNNGLVNLEKTT